MTHPTTGEPDIRRLAHGTGIAGFVVCVLAVVLFFVPFLDLMLALAGLFYCGRATALGRREDGPVPNGVALAMAGLVLGVLALVPGALITYAAAFQG